MRRVIFPAVRFRGDGIRRTQRGFVGAGTPRPRQLRAALVGLRAQHVEESRQIRQARHAGPLSRVRLGQAQVHDPTAALPAI